MRAKALVALASCALVGCGRWGFEQVPPGDSDIGAPDDDSPAAPACEPTPRPVLPAILDVVIGDGFSASCNATALQDALDLGGVIGFDCGPSETLITITQMLRVTKTTTLVGDGLIRLTGSGARVLEVLAPGQTVTLLDLKFTNTIVSGITGAAMFLIDGHVEIIGSELSSNTAELGGGAIAGFGPASLDIYDSSLTNNSGDDGGAIKFGGDLVIVRSNISSNSATAIRAGAPAGLGGAIAASGPNNVRLCGVTMNNNEANDLGGAMHRVSVGAVRPTTIESSVIAGNQGARAGGVYVQETDLVIRGTTLASNVATGGAVGGLFQTGAGSFVGENLTFASNSAVDGFGAGLSTFAAGSLSFSTFVSNSCQTVGCSGAGINATSSLSMRGVLLANNDAPAPGPSSCRGPMADGTASFQWPNEVALCAPAIQIIDADLAVTDRTGPYGTYRVGTPRAGSPAIGAVSSNCPSVDQLGQPRPTPCSAGAVEP